MNCLDKLTPMVYTVPIVEIDPEFDALYRIARRNGFKERDLDGKSMRYLSLLIACRDLGHFPKALNGLSIQELEAMLTRTSPSPLLGE